MRKRSCTTTARLKARQHQSPFKKDVKQHIDRAFVSLELARSARTRQRQDAAMEHYTACIALFLSTLPMMTDPRSDELVRTQLHDIMGEAEELKVAMSSASAESERAAPEAATVSALAPALPATDRASAAGLAVLAASTAACAPPLLATPPLVELLASPLMAAGDQGDAASEEVSADATVEEGEAQAPAPADGVATRRAVALFDFEPHDATELALAEGEKLHVLSAAPDGDHEEWVYARRPAGGEEGYVPAAFVELV